MKKNIQLLALTGWDDFIPVLWPSAKTFYEKYGKYPAKYNWVVPTCEIHKDFEENKKQDLSSLKVRSLNFSGDNFWNFFTSNFSIFSDKK